MHSLLKNICVSFLGDIVIFIRCLYLLGGLATALVSIAATAKAQDSSRASVSPQQIADVSTSSVSLPEAPQPQAGVQSSANPLPEAKGDARISGAILDTTGAVVPGAQVSLTQLDGKTLFTLVSGAGGEFTFSQLPAGSYIVTVYARGFAPYTSAAITLSSRQSYEVSDIRLAIGSAFTEVTVRPTEEIAAEQIKVQETQRVLAIFPNFYVSYAPDAVPMTTKQKFSLASHESLDWTSFVGISIGAGIQQANNSFAGYGQGAAGYGKRWAALFADGRSSDFLSHAVFASLFHQDPRYFYQGTGTKKSRLYHAVSSAFIARSDSGKMMPNYSYLLGTMSSGALSNAYYPHADRGASLVFVNAGIGIGGRAVGAVIQEFIGKKLTKNAPKTTPPESTQPATGALH
jgi:hypothetical protein